MVLTLLPKSKSANTSTDFFWKVMSYRMHGICAKFSRYLLSLSLPSLPASAVSITLAVLPVSVVSIASSLVAVTGVQVAKTDTSFLTLSLDSKDTYLSNALSNGRDSIWFGRCLLFLFC